MTDKEKLAQIEAYIKKNYDPEAGAKTSLWSHGNSNDVFMDGSDQGQCYTLWDISKMMELGLPEPEEQDPDDW